VQEFFLTAILPDSSSVKLKALYNKPLEEIYFSSCLGLVASYFSASVDRYFKYFYLYPCSLRFIPRWFKESP
ncbi:MAG: hypothetical protein RR614_12265, partial [Eubacterium sp.]